MTDKEKEAIEYLKVLHPMMWWQLPDRNGRLKTDVKLQTAIDTVLNLIGKQQKEIDGIYRCKNYIKKERAKENDLSSHGETLREALEDLNYKKLKSKETEKIVKQIKETGKVTKTQYRDIKTKTLICFKLVDLGLQEEMVPPPKNDLNVEKVKI